VRSHAEDSGLAIALKATVVNVTAMFAATNGAPTTTIWVGAFTAAATTEPPTVHTTHTMTAHCSTRRMATSKIDPAIEVAVRGVSPTAGGRLLALSLLLDRVMLLVRCRGAALSGSAPWSKSAPASPAPGSWCLSVAGRAWCSPSEAGALSAALGRVDRRVEVLLDDIGAEAGLPRAELKCQPG